MKKFFLFKTRLKNNLIGIIFYFLQHDLDDLHKEKHLDFRKEDVVCDTFFALVGAIYVDQVPNSNFLFYCWY